MKFFTTLTTIIIIALWSAIIALIVIDPSKKNFDVNKKPKKPYFKTNPKFEYLQQHVKCNAGKAEYKVMK